MRETSGYAFITAMIPVMSSFAAADPICPSASLCCSTVSILSSTPSGSVTPADCLCAHVKQRISLAEGRSQARIHG